MALQYFSDEFLKSFKASLNPVEYELIDYPQEVQKQAAKCDGIRSADSPLSPPVLDLELTKPETDAKQVQVVYSNWKELSDAQAADERLWAYMTHVHCWEYMQKRWSVAESTAEDKRTFIIERYFLKTSNNRWLIHNGIARLWWYGRLTYTSSDKFSLTDTMLSLQDIPTALLERSYGKNPHVLHAALRVIAADQQKMEERFSENKMTRKEGYQQLGIFIGLMGGVSLLDAMTPQQIEKAIKRKFL